MCAGGDVCVTMNVWGLKVEHAYPSVWWHWRWCLCVLVVTGAWLGGRWDARALAVLHVRVGQVSQTSPFPFSVPEEEDRPRRVSKGHQTASERTEMCRTRDLLWTCPLSSSRETVPAVWTARQETPAHCWQDTKATGLSVTPNPGPMPAPEHRMPGGGGQRGPKRWINAPAIKVRALAGKMSADRRADRGGRRRMKNH